MNIMKVIRKGAKNSRVQFADGTISLVPTSSLKNEVTEEDFLLRLKKLYSESNKKYFSGLLPCIKISLNNRTSTIGFFRRPRYFGAAADRTEIQFARGLEDMPDNAIEDTVLHEMIHAYQYFVLHVNDAHGKSFLLKAAEINRDGHNVQTRFDECSYFNSTEFYIIHTKCGSSSENLKFSVVPPKNKSSNQKVYKMPLSLRERCRGFKGTMELISLYGKEI